MKKIIITLLITFVSTFLFSSGDGEMMFSLGFEDSITPEIDHSLYMGEINYEKTWFYNENNFGISSDISFNLPISYRLGKDYSKPFETFSYALSLDYALKCIYRYKVLGISLGPSVRSNLFFSKENTVVAEALVGIENSICLTFPISSTFGINTGLDLISDFYRINLIKNGARGFISPRFDISFFIGLSLYYKDGFSFN